MFSRASAKPVGREFACAFQQRELTVRHVEVEIPGFGANRAVAIEQFDRRINVDGKAHRAAMATALQLHSTVTDFARLRG